MSFRPGLLAAATLAAAIGGCLALSRWGAGGNRDLAALTREFRRGEELKSQAEASRRRFEAKRVLADKVIAGSMTLAEAAGHFRRLNEAGPVYPPGLPPPVGDEPGLYEWVLDAVWEALAQDHQFAAAARWYAQAFAAHPHLLAGPPPGRRYAAARVAAFAGCGQGRDAADLDEKSRAGFRRQALEWLRAELEARHRLLEQEPERPHGTVADDLQRWLWDTPFAGVRDLEALARLPEAERQAWQKLWADVAATRARAQGKAPRKRRRTGRSSHRGGKGNRGRCASPSGAALRRCCARVLVKEGDLP
jgi:hypothetical protein